MNTMDEETRACPCWDEHLDEQGFQVPCFCECHLNAVTILGRALAKQVDEEITAMTCTKDSEATSLTLEDLQKAVDRMKEPPATWCSCNAFRAMDSLAWICPMHGNVLGDFLAGIKSSLNQGGKP